MKTPSFWESKNIISFLLYPFSLVYGLFRFLHVLFSSEYKTNMNIICIGNLTAGGSGKTPLAIKIGEIFKDKNINFAYLIKGYKGNIKTSTKVDLSKHTFKDVGDEALLLAKINDTFISNNRKIAIEKLSKNYNYDTIIMDDGFQNPTIFKNKNIVVIDGEYGIGNGKLLPAGPLREKIKSAIKRVNFIVLIGQDKQNLEENLLNNKIEVIKAFIKEKNISNGKDKYIAFCGIGRCEKFFNSLKKSNYNLVKTFCFSDHYKYKDEDIQKILLEAEKRNSKIITTKKDWVRLSESYKNKMEYLDIEINFYNYDKFMELLLK